MQRLLCWETVRGAHAWPLPTTTSLFPPLLNAGRHPRNSTWERPAARGTLARPSASRPTRLRAEGRPGGPAGPPPEPGAPVLPAGQSASRGVRRPPSSRPPDFRFPIRPPLGSSFRVGRAPHAAEPVALNPSGLLGTGCPGSRTSRSGIRYHCCSKPRRRFSEKSARNLQRPSSSLRSRDALSRGYSIPPCSASAQPQSSGPSTATAQAARPAMVPAPARRSPAALRPAARGRGRGRGGAGRGGPGMGGAGMAGPLRGAGAGPRVPLEASGAILAEGGARPGGERRAGGCGGLVPSTRGLRGSRGWTVGKRDPEPPTPKGARPAPPFAPHLPGDTAPPRPPGLLRPWWPVQDRRPERDPGKRRRSLNSHPDLFLQRPA